METVVTLLSLLCVSGALAQCRTDPGLSITAPPQMEALSGSCLLIPCNFSSKPKPGDQFISTRTIYGVWIKSDYRFGKYPDNVVYNGSLTDNIYPMNIRGNLSQTNCTTLFSNLTTAYTDSYYFRVENGPYKATASCDPLQINVTDSPQTPLITITQRDLKENQSVTISCSAPTPCPLSPPKLTWSLQQDPHNNMEENPDGTFTTQIQETITLSDQHDGSNISCSATYPVNGGHNNKTAETQVTLSVSYAPKDTSASISPSGSWVNLTCSSRAKPPVSSFTWFQISTDGAVTVSEGAFYRLNATQGGVYYCVASNGVGNQTSPQIRLPAEGSGETEQPLLWEQVAGGVIGVIAIIGVIVAIWWIRSRQQSLQTQSPAGENPGPQKPAPEDEPIHYGEISFSRMRPEASPGSGEGDRQQQDIVYAKVKMSKNGNAKEAADGPEDLYAHVKTK